MGLLGGTVVELADDGEIVRPPFHSHVGKIDRDALVYGALFPIRSEPISGRTLRLEQGLFTKTFLGSNGCTAAQIALGAAAHLVLDEQSAVTSAAHR